MFRRKSGSAVRRATRTTTTPLEAAAVVVICFGVFILLSARAVTAGFADAGRSPSSITAITPS